MYNFTIYKKSNPGENNKIGGFIQLSSMQSFPKVILAKLQLMYYFPFLQQILLWTMSYLSRPAFYG